MVCSMRLQRQRTKIISSQQIYSRSLPSEYRLLSDQVFSVSYFEDVWRKVFPVFPLGLAFKEFHVLPVLGIPPGELPVNNALYLPILDNDVARREVGVCETDAMIRSHLRRQSFANRLRTLVVEIQDERIKRLLIREWAICIVAIASAVSSETVYSSNEDLILSTRAHQRNCLSKLLSDRFLLIFRHIWPDNL